jgi:hypothetical protein
LGDLNLDWLDATKKSMLVDEISGRLQQVVTLPTRISTRNIIKNNIYKLVESKRGIDLIFVSNELQNKMIGQPLVKDSPSDHLMVEVKFRIGVPSKFVDVMHYKDPTKRPRISQAKLVDVNNLLLDKLGLYNFKALDQKDGLCIIEKTIVEVLDKFSPLNSGREQVKRLYRFKMSETTRELKKSFKTTWKICQQNSRGKSTIIMKELKDNFKAIRKEYNYSKRRDKRRYSNKQLTLKINEGVDTWSIIKSLKPKPLHSDEQVTVINGKYGTDLANHMADYLHDRANLVSDKEILDHIDHVPLPDIFPQDISDCITEEKFCVSALLKPKSKSNKFVDEDLDNSTTIKEKYISLACGPDTISHRHLYDLLPSIKDPLNVILHKPLITLGNIDFNYNRLISKTFSGDMTEKSQRPIAELNVMYKYTTVRLFINSLMKRVMPRMITNQYSFPGKGTQMATVELLDTISYHLNAKMCVLVIFYDMSNAFCTCPAEKVIQIAENFGVCGTMKNLLVEFLDQTTSVIKMNDSRGHYRSKIINTGRGCQQGQVGSDFIFTMLNDGIRPIQYSDEFIQRIKYVDDFVDIIAHKSKDVCFKSLETNSTRIKQQATSVGLKLNENKTQIISANIPEEDLDIKYTYLPQFKYLGYIGKTGKRYNKTIIDGDVFVDKIIAELNAGVHIIRAMLRTSSIYKRVDAATKYIWSRCGSIGIAYVYASSKKWSSLCIAIKKVIKS